MNYCIVFSFNGRNFEGFQRQPNIKTVQSLLEDTISGLFNEKIIINGCSRTDKGVHALNMSASFKVTIQKFTDDKLLYVLNRLLHGEIYIKSLRKVDDNFHARFSAKNKTYLYVINNNDYSPILNDLVWQVREHISMGLLKESSTYFLGSHKFLNYCSSELDDDDFNRTINWINIYEKNDLIHIEINGNGFKRYMVRFIVGTMVNFALDKIDVNYITSKLNCVDNEKTKYKAPSCGLYLKDVFY